MRPALRPRLLGHLRDLLAEKDQDISELRARLRASEEVKGDALGRLERLEAQLGVPSPSSSSFDGSGVSGAGDFSRAAAAALGAAHAQTGEAEERLRASQRFVDQLREQFAVASAGRASLAEDLEAARVEADAHRHEVVGLRERLAAVEQQHQRDVSMLRSQLGVRDGDVARLERRLGERLGESPPPMLHLQAAVEGLTPSSGTRTPQVPFRRWESTPATTPRAVAGVGLGGGRPGGVGELLARSGGGGIVAVGSVAQEPLGQPMLRLVASSSAAELRPAPLQALQSMQPPLLTQQQLPLSPSLGACRGGPALGAPQAAGSASGLERSHSVPVQLGRVPSPRTTPPGALQGHGWAPPPSQGGVSLARWAAAPGALGQGLRSTSATSLGSSSQQLLHPKSFLQSCGSGPPLTPKAPFGAGPAPG
mmetsp:Transcript_98675/g.283620  ORF Transcript_98675/g.283620 Transcript_98675/m.283620 type:complete len:423 (+) Transcript_98675:120-1388(+)